MQASPNSVSMIQYLQVLARYRRKDPASAEEQELVENTFDALCSALMVKSCACCFHSCNL